MSDGRAYRFEFASQLGTCLRVPLPAKRRLTAAAGESAFDLAGPPRALVVLGEGQLAWGDADGVLRAGDTCAGPMVGDVDRLTASDRRLWTVSGDTLEMFEAQSLERLARCEVAGVSDIAGDSKGGIWASIGGCAVHFDASARQGRSLTFAGVPHADRIVVAGDTPMLISLRDQRLYLHRGEDTARALEIGDLAGARFIASHALSDGQSILLTGYWNGAAGFVVLDGSGSPLSVARWTGGEPKLVTLLGEAIWAVFDEPRGVVVRRFADAARAGGEVWLTPALESDLLSGAWHRAEISAELPWSARCSIDFAATVEESLVRAADGLADDTDSTPAERLRNLDRLLPWSGAPLRYTGEQRRPPFAAERLTAPMSGAPGNFLWLRIAFEHGAAPCVARLGGIVVHHDEPGLMDYLPAVFREPTGDADGTLRRLVDTFEGTFLDFDTRIAALAGRLDPDLAEARWLPALARLLELPFDAALDERQQRAVLRAGAEIIAWRGTRRGVIVLLTALFDDRSFSVVDRTAQFAPLALGGGGFTGSTLPALVTGSSVRTARLNARLVLGRTPLCTSDPCTHGSVARGADLLVVIPGNGNEAGRLGPAVRQMIEAVLPAGITLTLRWTGWSAAGSGDVLATVADPPRQILGGWTTPLGAAVLGGRGGARLGEGGIPAEHQVV